MHRHKPFSGPLKLLLALIALTGAAGCAFLPNRLDGGSQGGSAESETPALYGTILDSRSGNPILNAEVQIGDGEPVPAADGQFHFEGLEPGFYQLRVSAPYHHPRTVDVFVFQRASTIAIEMDTVFTDEELETFAAIIRAEAEGEPYTGQVAVAASILNRWRSPLYPNSLTEVIYQRVGNSYQYSPVLDGRIHLGPNESAWRAAGEAIAGADPSLGATGFFAHNKVGPNSWVRRWPVTVVIGNHTFFRPTYEELGMLPG